MTKILVKKGEVFGNFIIIKELDQYIQPSGKRKRKFLVKCICGKNILIRLDSIVNNRTISCGCKRIGANITHGMSNTRIAHIYYGIIARCNNNNDTAYGNYGGRGIKCEWESFENFYEDMKDGYEKHLTIDRINVDGNYYKENCRWATQKEQMRNTRRNVYYKGKCITEWAEQLGIKKNTIQYRLYRGWTFAEALELTPR